MVYSRDGELGEDKKKRCLVPLVRVDQRQRFTLCGETCVLTLEPFAG